jgi:hypothetical protein
VRVRERVGLAVGVWLRERVCVCVRVRELVGGADGDGVLFVVAVAQLLVERELVCERLRERERVCFVEREPVAVAERERVGVGIVVRVC